MSQVLKEREIVEFRPPLAQNLFDRRRMFGEVLDEFPQCAFLVDRLRRAIAEGRLVEAELEVYEAEASTYPNLQRALLALRFYLQQIIWRSGSSWWRLNNGVTNYGEFLYQLDRWRDRTNERVCIVTFNYDLLLDEALTATLGIPLTNIGSYVAPDHLKYLKLHGSVNWGRLVASPGNTTYGDPGQAKRVLIENASALGKLGDFRVRTPGEDPQEPSPDGPHILLPALAVPVQAKSEFVCPDNHVATLDACLAETQRILVVGWRGTERHFLQRFELLPGLAPKVLVVGGDAAGAQETRTNLAEAGLDEGRIEMRDAGFSEFVSSPDLSAFLESPVR